MRAALLIFLGQHRFNAEAINGAALLYQSAGNIFSKLSNSRVIDYISALDKTIFDKARP